jgi:hypothetical protein
LRITRRQATIKPFHGFYPYRLAAKRQSTSPTPPYRELRGGKESTLPFGESLSMTQVSSIPQLNRIFYGKRLTSGKKCVKIEKQKKKKI